MFFPFLAILFIITLYISIRQHNSAKTESQTWNEFIQKEQEANWTRKQDLDNLAYIKLPLEQLPLGRFDDEALRVYEDALRDLSTQPICNLNGISNTDLKMQYGIANLNALSECDTNYSTLVSLLANYGEKLYELSHISEAREVLEYSLTLGSDIGKAYELLADIYEQQGHHAKLDELRRSAENITSIRKNSILRKLDARRNQNIQTQETEP